ncbi:MAG: hypothetical protein HY814_00840 [Candidatus Riflebacteria bacterium]|nr:hypothetical protein [Candidatus Riflebacteria bacterium]
MSSVDEDMRPFAIEFLDFRPEVIQGKPWYLAKPQAPRRRLARKVK